MRTLDRDRLLAELGYGRPEAREAALDVLCAAGLTNPRKTGIAAGKRERVREALRAALVRVCPRCAPDPGDVRRPVPAEGADCERCGGSANRAAVDRAAEACRERGLRRVVVVGGAPGVHTALSALWPRDLELRIVPGTERQTLRQARANLAWGDVVIVWAATELDHKISDLYTKTRDSKVVTARRRSIQALADRLRDFAYGARPE